MITNPQVGMRVICSNPQVDMRTFRGHIGIIVAIHITSGYPYRVKFSNDAYAVFDASELDVFSPENEKQYQDKLQREKYADQYL